MGITIDEGDDAPAVRKVWEEENKRMGEEQGRFCSLSPDAQQCVLRAGSGQRRQAAPCDVPLTRKVFAPSGIYP